MSNQKRGYEAYAKESRSGLITLTNIAIWAGLLVLLLVTGVHAISLVIRHHGGNGSGVIYWIQVVSPILTEVFTGLVTIGFTLHMWRGAQKWLGRGVEVIWVAFAALNLVSEFTMRATGSLSGMLSYWVSWGLPVSALVTGVLLYLTKTTSPENARIEAEKAADDQRVEDDFTATQEVYDSAEYETIRRRKVWVQIVNGLKREGFDDHDIAFMTQRTPQLIGYDPSATPIVVEGQTVEEDAPAPQNWLDRLRGRQPEPKRPTSQPAPAPPTLTEADMLAIAAAVAAMSNPTHSANVGNPTHDTARPVAQPEPAQPGANGARPNA